MTLPAPGAGQAATPRSFFQRFKDAGQAVLDKRKLKSLLLESVSDGVLTAEELEEIRALMARTGIDKSILAEWGEDILERAVDSISLSNLSLERVHSVESVKDFLGVENSVVQKQLQRLDRWRYIATIRKGTLPVQDVKNLVLRKNEIVHWVEPGKLWEERVVRSVANLTRQDAIEFLALAARTRIKTHVVEYPLADANRALDDLRAGRIQGAAVLIP